MMYLEQRNRIPKEESFRDYLKDFLDNNSVSPESAAKLIKVSRGTLEKYLNGGDWDIKASCLTPLSLLLDVDVDDILLALGRDTNNSSSNFDNMKACAYIINNFSVAGLKECGIIKKRTTIDTYEKQITQFLGLSSIFDYDSLIKLPSLFSKSNRSIEERKQQTMTEFWIKTSVIAFKSIDNPYEYRPDILELFLKGRICPFTQNVENGFEQTVKALYRMGVTVIVQQYIKNTGIYGTSMIINGKPCITLSNQGRHYYKLWLTLVHELYHILHDYDMLQSTTIHTSDKDQLDALFNETEADDFACQVFVKKPAIEVISKQIHIPYLVESAAKQLSIHPTMLYGVCFEWNYRKHKIDILKNHSVLINSDQTITNICFDPCKQNTLNEAIEILKETLTRISV